MHVLALDIPHTGGRTFGFRVSDGSAAVAYLSDHNPIQNGPGDQGLGPYHEAALALAAGVDLLIHDAQHTAAELSAKAVPGHSAINYAVGLGRTAGPGGCCSTTTTSTAPTTRSTPSWPPSRTAS